MLGTTTSSWIVNGIDFSNTYTTNYCVPNGKKTSAKIITIIFMPYSGNTTFSANWDYYWSIYIDDIQMQYKTKSTNTFNFDWDIFKVESYI